jgi:hypothetical protein
MLDRLKAFQSFRTTVVQGLTEHAKSLAADMEAEAAGHAVSLTVEYLPSGSSSSGMMLDSTDPSTYLFWYSPFRLVFSKEDPSLAKQAFQQELLTFLNQPTAFQVDGASLYTIAELNVELNCIEFKYIVPSSKAPVSFATVGRIMAAYQLATPRPNPGKVYEEGVEFQQTYLPELKKIGSQLLADVKREFITQFYQQLEILENGTVSYTEDDAHWYSPFTILMDTDVVGPDLDFLLRFYQTYNQVVLTTLDTFNVQAVIHESEQGDSLSLILKLVPQLPKREL